MKDKFLFFIAFLFSIVSYMQAQYSVTSFSVSDGLSQNSVDQVFQDSKGRLWLATWDGLNFFDGYTFHNYKGNRKEGALLSNNRVSKITEDKYGYIWIVCNNGEVFRFDPSVERFQQVELSKEYPIYSLKALSNGHVWLIAEKGRGAARIVTDPHNMSFKIDVQEMKGEYDGIGRVKEIYLDADGNEWLLSNERGLFYIKAGSTVVNDKFSYEKSGLYKGVFSVWENNLYILFGANSGCVWKYDKRMKRMSRISLQASSAIHQIIPLMDGSLMLVSRSDGFFVVSPDMNDIKAYNSSTVSWMIESEINKACMDHSGTVWIQFRKTFDLLQFLPSEGTAVHHSSKRRLKTTDKQDDLVVLDDDNGHVWVYPYMGVALYQKETKRLLPLDLKHPQLWNASEVHFSIFLDMQGTLWVSTMRWFGKVILTERNFECVELCSQDINSEKENALRSLMYDDGFLWVGTRAGKLVIYDNHYTCRASFSLGIPYCMMKDKQGRYWIGTKGNGLFCAEPSEKGLDFNFTQYTYRAEDIYSLSNNSIYSLYQDQQGAIWVATFGGGLNLIDEDCGVVRFLNHRNELVNYPMGDCSKVRTVTSDGKGNIWVGTTGGALMFPASFGSPEDIDPLLIQNITGDAASLRNNNVHSIFFTKKGEGFLGTFGGGLCRIEGERNGTPYFRSYTIDEGMQSDIVYAIQEDLSGNLWIAGESGLTKFNPETGKLEKYGEHSIGFPVMFSEGSFILFPQGKLGMPTYRGLFCFEPEKVKKREYNPPIVFSDFKFGNKVVHPGEHKALPRSLEYMDGLKLTPDERVFSIEYAALETCNPEGVNYAYILEGFDEEWRNAGTHRSVSYTNLPKGHYVFKVRSTNGDGVWVDNTRLLKLEMLPSFWETPWARLLYVSGALFFFWGVVRLYMLFYSLKNKVYIEKELSEAKLRVFTDVSHELRTPLTLITAPVENLLQQANLSSFSRKQLELVRRNTDRMLRLVNQILDFRKLQNHMMHLCVEQIELVGFIRKLMRHFEPLAGEHRIYFTFTYLQEAIYLWADADKLEKILFNLLSNAFKYTPDGKLIEIYIREDDLAVYIGVRDEGIGIPSEKMKILFQRFNSWHDKSLSGAPSTGIGLSVVKELVELHKGHVYIESEPDKGSCFELKFLRGKEHYGNQVDWILRDGPEGKLFGEDLSCSLVEQDGRLTILIVEDNAEMRSFLSDIFGDAYNVVEAIDGEEGVEVAKARLPALIISDIMMPRKDGLDLVVELKNDLNTSHIPIIMLTAKTRIDSKLISMKEGADDYITKPFSALYLKARVSNLLAQRERMKAFYCQSLMEIVTDKDGAVESCNYLSESDRKFMDKLIAIMEANMDNSDLTVDDLVKEFALSRSSFFRKLNNLTDMSPVEFILQMRMKRAAQFIVQNRYTMSEIALMVGISNPHYFSRCFKKVYSMTPSEYKERMLSPHN